MSKHTPGPWLLVEIYTSQHWAIFPAAPEGDFTNLATVHRSQIESENEANAHLIAAAPDMLEALKAFRGYLDGDLYARLKLVEEQADAAIAKAEGKL